MAWRALTLALTLLAGSAQAQQLLREVVQHAGAAAAALESGGEAPELEILLGVSVVLTDAFSSTDGRVHRGRLVAAGDPANEWQFAELRFDEPGYDVIRVSMEGSAARGYTLEVEFRDRVATATLPQYANDRIALKYLDQQAYRRAVARSSTAAASSEFWAVVLEPAVPLLQIDQVPRALLANRALYVPASIADAVAPRLGFFSESKARSVLADARGAFPSARVVAVSEQEVAYGRHMRLNTERLTALYAPGRESATAATAPQISIATATAGAIPDAIDHSTSELVAWNEQIDDSLLRQAKEAYIAGDYDRAVALYTQAAELPPFRLEALEMLGVTREQNRQLAQAKLAYETALAEFPERPEARRIRARLDTLLSVDHTPRALRKPTVTLNDSAWQTSSHLSQFYRRYSLHIDRQGTTVPVDAVFSDLDVTARRSGTHTSHEARAALGHLYDLSADGDDRNIRVGALYWHTNIEPLRTGVRLGRQSQRRSGVLNRFDGVAVSHAITSGIELQALGGWLLDSSYDSPQSQRPFWGVNAELSFLDERLSVTPFYVQQDYDGILDRQAVGVQGELYADHGSYFAMLDYDLHYQAINHALFSGNLRVGETTRVFGSIDHRRSPYLTARNALIGQPVDDLSELELLLVEEQIDQLAEDRSAVSTMLRLGIDQRLSRDWALSVDASVMDFGATESSANVEALPAHRDFSLYAQLRSDNAFGQGNFGALQMRYFHSDTTRAVGAYFNNRFTLWRDWWLYPRLAVDQRQFGEDDLVQRRIRPSLRVDHRWGRHFRLELEAGYEWTSREMISGDLDMQGWFIMAGYRLLL